MPSPFLELIDKWSTQSPNKTAFVFLNSLGEEQDTITYQELHSKALKVAQSLTEMKLAKERVILALSPNLDFIASFLGCLYAQSVAVPLPPPKSKRQLSRTIPVIEDANPKLVIADSNFSYSFNCPTIFLNDLISDKTIKLPRLNENDIAFLQYTSGSTSLPKGVILTHDHLYHHQQVIKNAFNHNSDTKVVGWLPFYHDMGLIGNILQTLYLGVTSILMSPMTFMQRPLLWLKAISDYQATTSGGPNFAYEHCISKISDEEAKHLDLTSWKLAFNGAERVHDQTLKNFARKFSAYGFSKNVFYPCYGMAETTLFVSGRHGLLTSDYEIQDQQTGTVVSCGKPDENYDVSIVDPTSQNICSEGISGEVWVKGRSVASGYWNNSEATAKTFQAYTSNGAGPFLRTGDLGFIKDNELYLLGRLKNLIIIRGKNFLPHDLELTVRNAHPLLSTTQGVVISVTESNEETLVVVQEISRQTKDKEVLKELAQTVKNALIEEFEITPKQIIFVTTNSLPRTTSGKLQHYKTRQLLDANQLNKVFAWSNCKVNFSTNDNVLDALSKILQIHKSEICSDQPLFSLGLDSLSGMQFINWVNDQYQTQIDLSTLLNGATLVDIEKYIEGFNTKNHLSNPQDLKKYPLSWNQESVWIDQQMNPHSNAYNIHFALKLTGPFDPERFKKALKYVIDKHPALRTSFHKEANQTIQVVNDHIECPLTIQSVKNRDELSPLLDAEQAFCFDLSSAPLFRITCFLLSSTEVILSVNFHHLISDGWSIKIFIEELEKTYSEFPLTKNTVEGTSYAAYIEWQKNFKKSPKYLDVAQGWKKSLKSEEYPRLEICPFKELDLSKSSKTTSLILSTKESDEIKNFAMNQGVTIPVTLLSCFQALLHLYANTNEMFVGYPDANRPHAEFQKVIGFFVNTLVCKTKISSSTTYQDILKQVKGFLWQGNESSAYPFNHLLDLLRPPRDKNTSPLFQAMFVMQSAPTTIDKFALAKVELLKTLPTPSLYDLVLEVRILKSGLELIFEYKRDKISDLFALEFKKSFKLLLTQAINNPNRPLSDYALGRPHQATLTAKPKESEDVVSRIEAQGKINPKKLAIVSDHENYTYEKLLEKASFISKLLITLNLRLEEPIGVCFSRKPILIASLLGILKAGGAYVPLDPAYPQDRIEAIIRDAKIRFILTEEKMHSIFSFYEGTLLDPHTEVPGLVTLPQTSPNQLAYILYTSGTTGKPKGVMVERKSLANFAKAALSFFEMREDDKCLQFSSISWDTSSEEIFPCLLCGATLILRSDSPVESFSSLLARANEHQITTWNLPTSYWHDLVEFINRKNIDLPVSLRLVIVGGEKVNKRPVHLWTKQLAPSVKLLNTYGSTEATSISAIYDLANWPDDWIDTPIGHSIENVELCVLNSSYKPTPPGMPGELYIGGLGLSRGYLNLPELTTEKFIKHPYSNERLYRTGDEAYTSFSGEVLIKGRSDRQVKRRGFRIELAEIENILRSHKDIETSLVTFDKEIIAYIVLKNKTCDLTPIAFKDFLRQRLPDYFIPDRIAILGEIPRLTNGKIDYLSLKKFSVPNKIENTIESLTETESQLLAIWESVLDAKVTSREESFFDLGGNSLLMIQLHEKIEETFSVQLNISLFFSYYTIASQAQKIDEKLTNSVKPSTLELLKQLEKGQISPSEAHTLLKQTKR